MHVGGVGLNESPDWSRLRSPTLLIFMGVFVLMFIGLLIGEYNQGRFGLESVIMSTPILVPPIIICFLLILNDEEVEST